MTLTRLLVAICAAVSMTIAVPCAAQTERGTITGVVTDSTGAIVPGVAVKVINTATNVAANVVSSDSGSYTAVNLQPGPYRVEATLTGFQTSNVTGITLPAGGSVRVDVTLNLGAVTESLNVVAEATPLQTEDARVATSVSNKLIDELPLVVGGAMRSPYDLVSTVPEARGTALGGGQSRAYGATLDGISVNTNRNLDIAETALLAPSLEAITEFNVETNGFKPEYGQAAGGLVTFASKSGTNNLSGSLYGFHRNDALDRRTYSEEILGQDKGIFKQSDFGASFGGPVRVGKLYNGRDRTFFFASYEGFHNKEGSNSSRSTVPTPEMWNGDFSNWVDENGRQIPIFDPLTTRPNPNGTGFIRDQFPGNRIPVERFSNVAKQYIALGRSALVPNAPTAIPGTLGYVDDNYLSEGKSSVETTHKYSLKVDHVFSNTHRISYLFNRTNNDIGPGPEGPVGLPEPFSGSTISTFDADLHRASWDWVGAKMVNHFTVGANTFNKNAYSINYGKGWADRVCIPRSIDCDINMGAIGFTELSGWGGSSANGTEQPRFTLKNDLTFLRGSHTLKAGVTYDHQEANGFGQQNIMGRANFSYRQTGRPGQTTFANAGGASFASFLLGTANDGSLDTNRYLQQNFPYYGFYVQDDWRLNNKLVFNYGLRYEFTRPPYEGSDQYAEFSPTTINPKVNYPGAIIFAGDGPGRTGERILSDDYFGAIAPRASFAYSINDKTILRGGVGRSFGRITAIGSSNHSDGFVLRANFPSASDGFSPLFNLDTGLPAYNLPPFIDPAVSNNLEVHYWNNMAARPATYDTWTISLQREVRRGMTVEVDYNGSKGSHLHSNLVNLQQVPMSVVDDLAARFGRAAVDGILRSNITSATARNAGFTPPYAAFTDPSIQPTSAQSVAQSLRAFPQYGNINLQDSGGDKTGRSRYHAGILKVSQRLQNGLMFQGSYAYSRMMTDSESFSGSNGSMDTARPELEYSVSSSDQPHIIKLQTVWELPFGPDRRWLTDGPLSHVLGGWRIAAVQSYSSGTPIGVTSPAPLQIFNRTNRPNVTGADWRAPIAGDKFDPLVDKFLNRAAFVQPVGELGNAPRTNPNVRRFWNKTENVSLAKTVTVSDQFRFDVRMEAFNVFNRIVWGAPVTDFNSSRFGEINSQGNSPRQMQFGFKLYW
jgi:hypothetical protein